MNEKDASAERKDNLLSGNEIMSKAGSINRKETMK